MKIDAKREAENVIQAWERLVAGIEDLRDSTSAPRHRTILGCFEYPVVGVEMRRELLSRCHVWAHISYFRPWDYRIDGESHGRHIARERVLGRLDLPCE